MYPQSTKAKPTRSIIKSCLRTLVAAKMHTKLDQAPLPNPLHVALFNKPPH